MADVSADLRVLPPPGGIPGIVQPVFGSGDANTPTAASWFPDFTPIVPPPPIGDPVGPPDFPPVPPDTAPVDVPLGPLVGPAVTGDLVGPPPPPYPPSFATGSASAPTAASWFPQFTTTFPVPTVVFANIFNFWPAPVPTVATTQNVTFVT